MENDTFVLTCEPRKVFQKCFESLKTSEEVKAYLSSLFYKMIGSFKESDPVHESIVLSYFDAKLSGDFDKYRRVGDYVTWIASMFPENLSDHYDMSIDMARSSYYACWRLLNKRWGLYKELGDDLFDIVVSSRKAIIDSRVIDLKHP